MNEVERLRAIETAALVWASALDRYLISDADNAERELDVADDVFRATLAALTQSPARADDSLAKSVNETVNGWREVPQAVPETEHGRALLRFLTESVVADDHAWGNLIAGTENAAQARVLSKRA